MDTLIGEKGKVLDVKGAVVKITVEKIVPEQVRLKEENSGIIKNTAEATDVLSFSPLLQKIYCDMAI